MSSITARQTELLDIDADYDDSGITNADKAEGVALSNEKAQLYGCSVNMVFVVELLQARLDSAEAQIIELQNRAFEGYASAA